MGGRSLSGASLSSGVARRSSTAAAASSESGGAFGWLQEPGPSGNELVFSLIWSPVLAYAFNTMIIPGVDMIL